MGFFQGTQERIRLSRGERAISIRPIEVLLYTIIHLQITMWSEMCSLMT